jgi:hypothetical protein
MKRALALAAAIALFFPAISPAQGISTPSRGIKRLLIQGATVLVQGGKPDGSNCFLDEDCESLMCVNGRCAAAPEDKMPNGSGCRYSGQCESRLCFDFACSALPPRKKPLGAHCWISSACESGECDQKDWKCVNPPPPMPPRKRSQGEFCSFDDECMHGDCVLHECW